MRWGLTGINRPRTHWVVLYALDAAGRGGSNAEFITDWLNRYDDRHYSQRNIESRLTELYRWGFAIRDADSTMRLMPYWITHRGQAVIAMKDNGYDLLTDLNASMHVYEEERARALAHQKSYWTDYIERKMRDDAERLTRRQL